MFRTLGIKSLRVGGNTADRDAVAIPGKADIDSLFAFASAAGVKVIYTLRLNRADPQADADVAKYVRDHYKPALTGFALGNEPEKILTNYPASLWTVLRLSNFDHYSRRAKGFLLRSTATGCDLLPFGGATPDDRRCVRGT
jgi:hypothetical protein